MATEWAGIINTTITKYLKGAEDLTIRNRLELAFLESRGLIKKSQSGTDIEWRQLMKHPPVSSYADGSTIDFSRRDLYAKALLDWRSYQVTDALTQKEEYMNSGAEAIIRRVDEIIPNLTTALRNKVCAELYTDGYASNNQDRLCGFDSFTGTSTTVAADKIAKPDDTYATVATALGTAGGSWSTGLTTFPNANVATDWPYGQSQTPEYDYWTPKLVNWSSTSWGTGTTTWEDNCERALREAYQFTVVTGGKDGMPDITILAPNLMVGFQNHFSAKQRIMVPHKEANDLGFPNTLNFDGVGVTSSFDVAANTGYQWNFDQVSLLLLSPQLFVPAKDQDLTKDAKLFKLGFYGNLKFETPKFFAKLKNYA